MFYNDNVVVGRIAIGEPIVFIAVIRYNVNEINCFLTMLSLMNKCFCHLKYFLQFTTPIIKFPVYFHHIQKWSFKLFLSLFDGRLERFHISN